MITTLFRICNMYLVKGGGGGGGGIAARHTDVSRFCFSFCFYFLYF